MRKNILILGHNDATQFIDIYNQYTRLFPKEKYHVTVAFLTGAPSAAVRERLIAETVIFFDFPKKSLRTLKVMAIRKLAALCKENQFQIVICHRYKPTYIMLWVSKLYPISRLVFVMHELRTMSALGRQLLIACLRKNNMLFAGVSNAVRDDMRKNLWSVPTENVVTLYNTIDIDLFLPQLYSREEAREKLGIPPGDFVYGNLARLAPNKDHPTLISAFAKIKSQCPNAKIYILGDGALENSLKSVVNELKLENDIIFKGYVPLAYRYLRAFDCFVLSSVQEAFGRVLIEAMLAKLPIIATKVNGIPEVMGNIGFVIEPRQVDDFAHAMLTVYQADYSSRQQWGEEGFQHVSQHYAIPQFQQQFWNIPLLKSIQE